MLTWLRKWISAPRFEVRFSDFGFGTERERRAIVSSPWKISTKRLEAFVETENPYADPWLEDVNARLLMHEEEILITLPADCGKETLASAVQRIRNIRANPKLQLGI